MTQSPLEKGGALERAVRAIESAILTIAPELKKNSFTIECNKVFVVDGVKHEVDVYVEVDLGNEYKSVYIFECKNRKSKVNKNDIIVFSKKIDVLQAQKGFFAAKSFGRYALAQAEKDKRIIILLATEFDSALTSLPFDFHYCIEKNKNVRFDVVPKRIGNRNTGFPVDLVTAEAILDGSTINFEDYMDSWVNDLVNEVMKHYPEPNTPDGLYIRNIPAKRKFLRHKLTVNGKAIRHITLLIEHKVQIVRPAVLSHFEVEGRGRTLELAQVSHAGGDFKARITAVKRKDQLDADSETIDTALTEADVQKSRQIDHAIDQDIQLRDALSAAKHLVEKLHLKLRSNTNHFSELRSLQHEWHERGRDEGLNFDTEVAVELARLCLPYAVTSDEQSQSLNDLGFALQILGEREVGTQRLQEAVDTFEKSTRSITQKQASNSWALAQLGLGNALRSLGDRKAQPEMLERAVTAYETAHQTLSKDRSPLDWGEAKMGLGNALVALGERETGTERLIVALNAYTEARDVLTIDRAPFEWARLYMNAGIALMLLGQRQNSIDRLKEAARFFEEALKVWTRKKAPHEWGRTQMNLGNALIEIGKRETGSKSLKKAVAAFNEALKERKQKIVPLQWAGTQMNLGMALKALGSREKGAKRLDEAKVAFLAALTEWTRERVPLQWGMVQGNLADLETSYHDKTGEAARLDAAEQYAQGARAVFLESGANQYLTMSDAQLAEITKRRGETGQS